MDGFTVTELVTRAIKYFLEGLAVALATFIIPQKKLNVEEILAVAVVAAVTFALLDLLGLLLELEQLLKLLLLELLALLLLLEL